MQDELKHFGQLMAFLEAMCEQYGAPGSKLEFAEVYIRRGQGEVQAPGIPPTLIRFIFPCTGCYFSQTHLEQAWDMAFKKLIVDHVKEAKCLEWGGGDRWCWWCGLCHRRGHGGGNGDGGGGVAGDCDCGDGHRDRWLWW